MYEMKFKFNVSYFMSGLDNSMGNGEGNDMEGARSLRLVRNILFHFRRHFSMKCGG